MIPMVLECMISKSIPYVFLGLNNVEDERTFVKSGKSPQDKVLL